MCTLPSAGPRDGSVAIFRMAESAEPPPEESPIYFELDDWRGIPPMYFAVGGSESILGDSVLFAQKASHESVEVQLDVYEGMWHVFPMYSEGCGSAIPLWQGKAALRRTAKFIKSLAMSGKPPCSTHPGPPDGSTPFTVYHYNNPMRDGEWFPDEESCVASRSSRNTLKFAEDTPWWSTATISTVLALIGAIASAYLFVENVRLRRRLQVQTLLQ